MSSINLQGVKNIRSFQGIVCGDGQSITSGAFIRSGALSELTEHDRDILVNDLNLRTVIDLRTDKEIKEKPNVTLEDVKTIHVPLLNESVLGITHEEETKKEAMIPDMESLYRNLVTNEFAVDGLKEVFRIICDTTREGTVLWHCTEGKDRSGIVSALFLTLLGVGREEILRDYLLTNENSEKKARRYYYLVLLMKRNRIMAQRVRDAYRADSSYLLAAFTAIEEKYGSIQQFFTGRLGITEEQKERLRSFAVELTVDV